MIHLIASVRWLYHGGVRSDDAEAEQFVANPVLGELDSGVFHVSEVIHYFENDGTV